MKEIGAIIKQMDGVIIFIRTDQNLKENGIMIYNKAKEKNGGPMVLTIKDNMKKGKSKDKVYLNGLMDLNMKDNLKKTTYVGKVPTNEKIINNIQACGKITKCMERESLLGMMVEYILDSMNMIRNKDMVSFHGQMGECIKVHG